ncbi:MAG: LysR family transcriptional regulator [Pseudomonadota bacterium]
MPELRDMELLAALAKNRHFARAAAECGISQPAFSARIHNLELKLGAPIVKRGNRFMGFTEEGEIALKWAHRMIADARGLRQEIEDARDALSGKLVIGVVPTALTLVSKVAAALRDDHPSLIIQVLSHSSVDIAKGLEEFSIDAGVTYLNSILPAESTSRHIYDERYECLMPRSIAPDVENDITWQEAARLPLCLLTGNMRNRKIINNAFEAADAAPNLVMETNAFTAALVQVASGTAATIAPEVLIDNIGVADDVVRLKLIEPTVVEPIGIVISKHEPRLPAVDALMSWLSKGKR